MFDLADLKIVPLSIEWDVLHTEWFAERLRGRVSYGGKVYTFTFEFAPNDVNYVELGAYVRRKIANYFKLNTGVDCGNKAQK